MEDQKKPDEEEEELVNAFHVFDADGKGYIEASELRDLLKNMDDKMTEKELQDLLRYTHLDQDRKISFLGKKSLKKIDENFLVNYQNYSFRDLFAAKKSNIIDFFPEMWRIIF